MQVMEQPRRNTRNLFNFASDLEENNEIAQKVVISEDTIKHERGESFVFLSVAKKKQGRIIPITGDLSDFSLQISKKIGKTSFDANYQCKYCGKIFEKGCALGIFPIFIQRKINWEYRWTYFKIA